MHFARLSRLEVQDYAALVAAAATGANEARAHTSGSWQSACARHDQRAAAELRPMARSADIWKERAPEGIGRQRVCSLTVQRDFGKLSVLLSARLFLAAGVPFVGKCNGRGETGGPLLARPRCRVEILVNDRSLAPFPL